ncbi:MAG: peroxiredoxin [Myxococcales bacterium]|jgi:peroxiredoxin (alkyl hydroperoxide reductase subunit C)|nr:peroxiredoxin [Myxococcales bacterium]
MEEQKLNDEMPRLGDTAPTFRAETTQGTINFPEDYKGKWVILFSHPADFTPVCTTEFMTFASMTDQFRALNTELIGLSIDSNQSHIAWIRAIQEKAEFKGMKNVVVNFPIINDIKMEVSKKYGMIHPNASNTSAVRATFFIDPESKVRAIIYYPLTNGRNFQEIKRILMAMQTTDKYGVSTPADWEPGDEVIVPAPKTADEAFQRAQGQGQAQGSRMVDWYLSFQPAPTN